jgi:hypothetical protein
MNIFLLLSFTYLTMPYDGKVFSSGTAFSANKEAPENLFWNPAGMGENAYIASAFNYSGLIFGSFGKTWEKNNLNLGIGIQLLRSETMNKTNMMGESIGTFNYQSAVPLIAGNIEINKFLIGAKAFFPYTTVDEYQSYGLGVDIGGIYSPNELLAFSVYIRNYGKQIKAFLTEKENFPVESRLGGLLKSDKIMFSLEYSTLLGGCSSISYDFNKIIGFTAGYNGKIGKFNGIESSELAGLSFGVNIKHRKIYVSLGTIMCGPEGLSETISISFIP